MRRLIPILCLALAGAPLAAQQSGDIRIEPLGAPIGELRIEPFEPVETEDEAVAASEAAGAVLRGLDKVSGEVVEMEMRVGERRRLGRIEVTLGACRYPTDNPAGEAFAWVEVRSDGRSDADFEGWMIASSPALSALDHARYDVWVMRCTMA